MYAFGGFAGLMFNSFLQYSQGKFGLSRINFNTLENCSECGNIKSVMTEAFWTFNNYGNVISGGCSYMPSLMIR